MKRHLMVNFSGMSHVADPPSCALIRGLTSGQVETLESQLSAERSRSKQYGATMVKMAETERALHAAREEVFHCVTRHQPNPAQAVHDTDV